jgi:hypothetical protein
MVLLRLRLQSPFLLPSSQSGKLLYNIYRVYNGFWPQFRYHMKHIMSTSHSHQRCFTTLPRSAYKSTSIFHNNNLASPLLQTIRTIQELSLHLGLSANQKASRYRTREARGSRTIKKDNEAQASSTTTRFFLSPASRARSRGVALRSGMAFPSRLLQETHVFVYRM